MSECEGEPADRTTAAAGPRLGATAGTKRVSLRRIMRLFRPYRGKVALLLIVVVLQALAGVSSPFFVRAILDDALPNRDLTLLTALALAMVAAAVGGGALSVASSRLSNGIGQQVMHDIRVAMYEHLQRMSFAFFTGTRTGDLQSRIANDIGGVDNVLINTAATAAQSMTTAAAIGVALVLLSWKLALVSVVIMPVYLAFSRGVGGRRRALVQRRQARLADLTSLIEETMSVAGVLLSKTMGRQGELARRFTAQSAEIADVEVQAAMIGRWRIAGRRTSLTVIPAAVYWSAGLVMVRGHSPVSIGTAVAATTLLSRLISPAGNLQGIGINISSALVVFGRIFEVFDLPVDIDDRQGARELTVSAGHVAVRDVSFRYEPGGPWTLSRIDLDMPPGTTTALVGRTGSGKTTLAYLIARLYEPEIGQVAIDGVDVRDVTLASLSAAIGFVSQEAYLFHATIAENLRFAREDATDAEIEQAARRARIHDLISSLQDGYDTLVGERGYRFSGGERQRLAITRLLLRDPPIVILDEATSALDTQTERAVQEALNELATGRTTIAIAHRLSTVRTADQIVVLEGGRVVERGTREQLLALNGRFARLSADIPVSRP